MNQTSIKRMFAPLSMLGLLALLLLSACAAPGPAVPAVLAAPNAFSGPVSGGCYLTTLTTCRIQVDQWQPIDTDPGQKLLGFQLWALPAGAPLGSPLYDFRSDISNPPLGSYLPSSVRQGFAAQCGAAYQVSLRAKDSGDLDFEEVGRTNTFHCPAARTVTWQLYLPLVQ